MNKILNFTRSMLCALAVLVCFSAKANDKIHLTPEPGEVSEISEILISFDGDWALGTARSAKFKWEGPEGVSIPKVYSTSLGLEVGYLVYFEDDAVLTAPGTYTFTIPANKFECGGEVIPETSFQYVIVEEPIDPNAYAGNITVNPAPGTYNSIEMIVLEFDDDVEIVDDTEIIFADDDEVHTYTESVDNQLVVVPYSLNGVFATPGTYTLTIAAGALNIGGKPNAKLKYKYVVEEPEEPEFPLHHISPFPGLYDTIESGFSLEFATEEAVTVNAKQVWMDGPNGDITIKVSVNDNIINVMPVDDSGHDLALTEKGDYRLVFPYASVRIGDSSNQEPFVFVYSLSGPSSITDIVVDANTADEIFTTDGVRVGSDLRQLPTGVYIVNGKKQIHRNK